MPSLRTPRWHVTERCCSCSCSFFCSCSCSFLPPQIEGYYADPEADCQAFHICANDSTDGKIKYSFLCPNGTLFNQQYFICDWWFNVDCSQVRTPDRTWTLNPSSPRLKTSTASTRRWLLLPPLPLLLPRTGTLLAVKVCLATLLPTSSLSPALRWWNIWPEGSSLPGDRGPGERLNDEEGGGGGGERWPVSSR